MTDEQMKALMKMMLHIMKNQVFIMGCLTALLPTKEMVKSTAERAEKELKEIKDALELIGK